MGGSGAGGVLRNQETSSIERLSSSLVAYVMVDKRCRNRIVLTGCSAELDILVNLLRETTNQRALYKRLKDRALSKDHARMLFGLLKERPSIIRFDNIYPMPMDLLYQDEAEWTGRHWGASYGPYRSSVSIRVSRNHDAVEYIFDTDDVPVRWVQYLSFLFPTLGVAIHYSAPHKALYGSATFRAGRIICDRAIGPTDPEFPSFLRRHFDRLSWSSSDELPQPTPVTPGTLLFDSEHPHSNITNAHIRWIRRASTVEQIQQIRRKLHGLGLASQAVYTMLARHAANIPDKVLSDILTHHPSAAFGFWCRSSIPRSLAISGVRMTLDRLLNLSVPERPAFLDEIKDETIPFADKERTANFLLSVFHDAAIKQGIKDAHFYYDWVKSCWALRCFLVYCIQTQQIELSHDECELLAERARELASGHELHQLIRNAFVAALVSSPATPGHILRTLCPEMESDLPHALRRHSHIDRDLYIDLLERFPVDWLTQCEIAADPQQAGDPDIVRALLKPKTSPPAFAIGPDDFWVHPYALGLLLVHGPSSEVPNILETTWTARAGRENQAFDMLRLINLLPPNRRVLVPACVWAGLLSHSQARVRESALRLLGTIPKTSMT